MKLNEISNIVKEQGYAGSTQIVELAYLSLFSSACGKPVSLLIMGNSGAGKSYSLNKAKQFVPDGAYEEFEGMSEKAIVYLKDISLKNKHLIIGEAAGMANGDGRTLLRQLLSEGKVRYATVDTSNGVEGKTLPIIEGPTGLIMTTTAPKIHNEDNSRMLSVSVKESADAIRQVLIAQAMGISASNNVDQDMSPWHNLYWEVKESGIDVNIPYAVDIAERLPRTSEKIQRDFPQLLTLIKTHALMHHDEREVIDGKLQATAQDYSIVRDLVNEPMSIGLSCAVPDNIREIVEGVEHLSPTSLPAGVTQTKLAEHVGKNQSSISRYVETAVNEGYLINESYGQGVKASLKLGDVELPSGSVLPHPAELFERPVNDNRELQSPSAQMPW